MGNYPENHDFGDEFPEFGSFLKPELARAALLTLTKQERVVLSHRCQGKLLKEIAQELKVSRKAIEYHLGNIYQKLRLDQKGWGYSERKYFLLKNYCPVLRELIREINEEAVTEISEPLGEIIQLDPKIQAIIQMESEIEAAMDEDKPVKIEVPPQPPIVIRTQTPPSRPKRRYSWIFLMVIILAVGVVAFFLGQRYPYIFTPSAPISNQQGGVLLTPSTQAPGDALKPTEAEQVVPISTPEPPTDTPVPTDAPTETLVPTDIPTPTDTFTPTRAPVVLFEDNFMNGRLPEWYVPEGQTINLYWMEGYVTADGNVWMYTGDPEWTDYQLIVKGSGGIPMGGQPENQLYFAVRVVDPNNKIVLRVGDSFATWMIFENGESREVPNSMIGKNNDTLDVRITAEGNKFSAIVNTVEMTPYFDDENKFPQGGVGMEMLNGAIINYFKVVELP